MHEPPRAGRRRCPRSPLECPSAAIATCLVTPFALLWACSAAFRCPPLVPRIYIRHALALRLFPSAKQLQSANLLQEGCNMKDSGKRGPNIWGYPLDSTGFRDYIQNHSLPASPGRRSHVSPPQPAGIRGGGQNHPRPASVFSPAEMLVRRNRICRSPNCSN